MEDLFGQIKCRSESDSIVMRLLRSAMDKTHEKLQFKEGPIEFLHERTMFYQLAAILVEGGLNIVEEETDFLEGSGDKILSDLMEIRHWLKGRIEDMKQLIVEKDRQLTEKLENESELRQTLELKDRELVYLHEKLEPEEMKNDDINDQAIQDGATKGDISKLKNSVDQQVLNIKQKLEDEKKILTTERTRRSRASSPNLSFDFLDRERNESQVFIRLNFFRIAKFSELTRPNQNVLIRGMSSDIDILKETLDLAFGRMQSAEVLPLEKQWRWTIEKDIESILVKGFLSDLQENFDAQLKNKVRLFEDYNEMRSLFHELKYCFTRNSNPSPAVRRTTSEPFLDTSYKENLYEDDGTEVNVNHPVEKMIKNHESSICEQREQYRCLTREGFSSSIKKDKDRQERRIEDAIRRLNNFTKKLAGVKHNNDIQERRTPNYDIRSFEVEIEKLQEERDGLCFQISMMEDIYNLLFRSMIDARTIEFRGVGTERPMKNDNGGVSPNKSSHDHIKSRKENNRAGEELEGSTSTQVLLQYFDSTIREDVYVVVFSETVKQWKKNLMEERLVRENRRQTACEMSSDDFPFDSVLQESIGSLLKEDIYMVFLREMAEAWKTEKDACAIQSLIKDDTYQFVINEAVKDSHIHLTGSEALKQLDFQDHTPRSRKLNSDYSQEGTPRSRKLENDTEESLIQKLDSLLKCFEAEEDLMLRANSEIKEHSVNNSLVILNCEEIDERNAIEWLITDDESTFSSVSEKLERALQQLYTSKELLVELEQTLEVSDDLGDDCHQVQLNNLLSIELENTYSCFQQDDQVNQDVPSDNVLPILIQFQQVLSNIEHMLQENLESKCLRLEVLKRQVDTLSEPLAWIRKRKFLYKKAFVSRCHNLKLAETEVDLLGDQVESLLCLLEKIYIELNRNATVLSGYFEVYDLLKLIKRELVRYCKPES